MRISDEYLYSNGHSVFVKSAWNTCGRESKCIDKECVSSSRHSKVKFIVFASRTHGRRVKEYPILS